jgi:hypothetical protein
VIDVTSPHIDRGKLTVSRLDDGRGAEVVFELGGLVVTGDGLRSHVETR